MAPSPAAGPIAAAAGPAAASAVASEQTAPAPTDRDLVPAASGQPPRRRPARALAAVAALVVAGILAGFLWVQFGRPGGTVAQDDGSGAGSSDTPTAPAGSPTPSSAEATTDATPAPGPDGTGSAAPSASAEPSITAPKPSRTPRPTTPAPTRTRVDDSPSADDLASAIRSYYALMPADTDAAWPRMTASYQSGHAGGRANFERFWGQFQRVTVSNVSGQPPNRAEATITYYFKSGRVDTERTAFRLVNDDGQLKISRTTVLSSVSRGAGP